MRKKVKKIKEQLSDRKVQKIFKEGERNIRKMKKRREDDGEATERSGKERKGKESNGKVR